jgi:hypothetical protein
MIELNEKTDRVSLIKARLFKNLSILRYLHTNKKNYIGRHMSISVQEGADNLTYLDIQTENQLDGFNCFAKKNYITVPTGYQKPIMIGLDASYGNQNYIVKGNACYGWGTVLISSVDGDVSEKVIEDVKMLNRYVLMMSDKVFKMKGKESCIVPHYLLQQNMFNMLKVVAEGQMMYLPLIKLTKTLASYGYNYNANSKNRTIIIKDGPLTSGFFEPFGDALLTKNFSGRLEDEYKIYKTVALAGLAGVPIIGLTKHPTMNIMAKHFGEDDILDYSILKQIAEGDTYFFVGPFERKHARNPKYRAYYYYLYLEDRFSPLRLELLPDLLPLSIEPNNLVEDFLMALKCSNEGEIANNGEDYKLPACIANVDQTTRAIAKEKSAELSEALDEVRKKIPGAILDVRR